MDESFQLCSCPLYISVMNNIWWFNSGYVSPLCKLCNENNEELSHFLLYCPILEIERKQLLSQITEQCLVLCNNINIKTGPDAQRWNVPTIKFCSVRLQDISPCSYFHTDRNSIDVASTAGICAFFFLHQNQKKIFSNIENQNIFLEKNHNPPLFQVKWSFPYILQSNRAKFNSGYVSPLCKLCNENNEELSHFLLSITSFAEWLYIVLS
jgi:hypothetical protein